MTDPASPTPAPLGAEDALREAITDLGVKLRAVRSRSYHAIGRSPRRGSRVTLDADAFDDLNMAALTVVVRANSLWGEQ